MKATFPERVNLAALKTMLEAGMIRGQRHETLPLTIYKYSQQCVYTRTWNEITLRCRGVVLDDDGDVVVNGFPKFFNHSEPDGAPVYEAHKDQPYTVTEKLDGSLIQVALWRGHHIVTSSGSFTSEQAEQGRKMLEGMAFEEGRTYLFEIIYPGNRIVLDYGQRKSIVLLAVRDTNTGEEFPLDNRFECVASVGLSLAEIEAELERAEFINKEGYIVRWADGTRVKMKYKEYMRLHKIVSGVNEGFVWEAMRDGVDLEAALVGVPDELLEFVRRVSRELGAKASALDLEAQAVLRGAKNLGTRKEQAQEIIKHGPALAALAFAMLDGKDHWPKIWKLLEPVPIANNSSAPSAV